MRESEIRAAVLHWPKIRQIERLVPALRDGLNYALAVRGGCRIARDAFLRQNLLKYGLLTAAWSDPTFPIPGRLLLYGPGRHSFTYQLQSIEFVQEIRRGRSYMMEITGRKPAEIRIGADTLAFFTDASVPIATDGVPLVVVSPGSGVPRGCIEFAFEE